MGVYSIDQNNNMNIQVRKTCSTLRVLTLLCLFAATPSMFAQSTVIKAGHLFDSRTGQVRDNQVIIMKDGRIAQVGPNLKAGPADTVIDLSDSWVLPGLMDCHVHITSNYPYRKYAGIASIYATESTALRALRGAAVAKQLLEEPQGPKDVEIVDYH